MRSPTGLGLPGSSTGWSGGTCSWSRSTTNDGGSGSTTSSPRSPAPGARGWRPGQVAELHLRAAEWFRERGHIDEAFSHLMAAERRGEAAELARKSWLTYIDNGRAPAVRSWLRALGAQPGGDDPAADVTAAWLAALFGDGDALAVHLAALDGLADYGPLPDGAPSVVPAIALIRGTFGLAGPVDMLDAAQRAVQLEYGDRSPYVASAS